MLCFFFFNLEQMHFVSTFESPFSITLWQSGSSLVHQQRQEGGIMSVFNELLAHTGGAVSSVNIRELMRPQCSNIG